VTVAKSRREEMLDRLDLIEETLADAVDGELFLDTATSEAENVVFTSDSSQPKL